MAYIFLLSAFAAAGLLLLILGVRGRCVGDTPHCRRCGYDLSGHDDAERCSECGATLDAPRAIVLGVRRRGAVAVAFGGIVLLVAGSLLSVAGVRAYQRVDVYAYLPTGWLIDHLHDSRYADRASQELRTRYFAGVVPPAELARMIEQACTYLSLTDSPAATLPVSETDIILDAIARRSIAQEQVAAFFQCYFSVELDCPPTIRVGEALVYGITLIERRRRPTPTTGDFPISCFVQSVCIDGAYFEIIPGVRDPVTPGGSPVFGATRERISTDVVSAEEIDVGVEVQLAVHAQNARMPLVNERPLVEWRVDLATTTKVLPPDPIGFSCMADSWPLLDEWFATNLAFDTAQLPLQASGNGSIRLRIGGGAPAAYSAAVDLRGPDGWIEVGEFRVKAWGRAQRFEVELPGAVVQDAESITVRVRCVDDPHLYGAEVERTWGGTLIYDRIPITAPTPRTGGWPEFHGALEE